MAYSPAPRTAPTVCARAGRLIAAAGIAVSVGASASGALVVSTWASAQSGAWNNAALWSPNANFPNNGTPVGDTYHAMINATGVDYIVTLSTSVTLDQLTLNSANALLHHTAGSFNPGVANISAGTFRLNGGTVSGGTWNLSGTGVFDVGGNSSSLISNATINGDILISAGSARTRVSGATRFDAVRLQNNAASLSITPAYTLQDAVIAEGANAGARFIEMNGSAGTFTVGATGSITHAAGTAGDLNIGGSQWFGGAMTLVNNGLIQMDASGRNLNIQAASFTNNNDLVVNNGTVSINSWTNSGTVEMTGGVLNLGDFNVAGGIGSWNRTGGTVNINGAITNPGSFTLNANTGSWTLNGGSITGGAVNFAGGSQLLIGVSSSNLLSNVDVNGELILSSGSARTRLSGTTDFNAARLQNNATSLSFANGYTVLGDIVAEGAVAGARFLEMNGAAGTVTVGAAGSITHAAGTAGDFNIGGSQWFGGTMTLVNNGLIQMDAAGRNLNIQAASFTNNNDLVVNNGTVSINAWSNAGTVEVTGGVLNLGDFNVAGGIGTWNRTGGTVNINGAITNPGSFTLNANTGSWTLNGGSITGGAVNFAGGSQLLIGVSSSNLLSNVDVNGELILSTGSARTRLSGTADFNTARLQNNATSLSFANGYTVLGDIVAEGAVAGARFLEMNGAAGTVTVGAAGSITHAAGTAGDFNIGGSQWFGGTMTLVNNGLIQMDASGRSMNIQAASFTNNNDLVVNNGTVSINAWSNAGTVEVTGGVLNLGDFNVAGGIGTWNRTGGTVNINGAISNPTSFTLDNSTGSWTLNGGSITGGSLNFAGAAQLLIAASSSNLLSSVDVNGDLILSAGSARTRLSGTTDFNAARLQNNATSLSFANGYTILGDIVAEGATAGPRFLEMNGAAGTVTVGATGSITHAAGTAGDFSIGGSQWYGGAMTLINDGLIEMAAAGRSTGISGPFTNNGTLRLEAGTLNVGGPWTNTGTVRVIDGVLNLGAFNVAAGIGTWNRTGGTVNINGAISNPTSFTLNNSTGSWTLNGGSITGGSLNFGGAAQLLIAANSSNLLSSVDVNGELILSIGSARTRLAGTADFDVARLQNNATSLSFANGYTILGDIVAEGATAGPRFLEMNGAAGTVTVGATGSITHAAGVGGDLSIGGSQWFGGAMTLINDGLIEMAAAGRSTSISGSFTNNGTLRVTAGTMSVGGPWTNTGLVRVIDGVLNLGAFNSTGGIGSWNRTGGTVNINGAITNTAATLALNNSTGSWTLNGGSISGGAVNLNQSAQLLIGASSANNLVNVDINGDLTHSISSGRTLITGSTRFDAARLQNNATSLGFVNGYTLLDDVFAEGAAAGTRFMEMNGSPGTLTIGAAAAVTHSAGTGADFQVGGSQWFGGPMTLVNQGAIRAQASGRTLSVLAQSFDNQGEMEARGGGTLHVDAGGSAAFINNGQITAGTGGVVRFVDGYNTASSTGQLTAEIGGALTANYGRFNITGATSIDGSDIELDFVNGFNADWGDKFTILTFTTGLVTGDFSTFVLPALTDAVNWRWYTETTTTSVAVGVRHTSDINRDNQINFADLNIIVSNFNSNGSATMGDVDEDGFIGFADLNRVLSFFNTSAPINTVPAPGGAALLAALLGASLRRRR